MFIRNYGRCAVKKDSIIVMPNTEPLPSNYTLQQLARVDGANNTIYTITEDAFYQVEVQAGGGHSSGDSGLAGGGGGKRIQIVYLYKGTKCLLWGGTRGTTGDWSGHGITGYPSPSDVLGGTGATGASEGGGGGGGATNHGRVGSHADGSSGGGGAGFLAGIDKDVPYLTHKESDWGVAINTQMSWSVGDFSVKNLYCYILAGGGGGAVGKDDSNRSSGGGGGAYGNGGTTYAVVVARGTGPGGAWGKGQDGGHYSGGALGAWAVLDFSRDTWGKGTGGGPQNTNGYCVLSQIIPS